MKLTRCCSFLGLLLVSNVYAGQQVVQLEDGRQAVLNDDFTWKYLDVSANEKVTKPASVVSSDLPTAAPMATSVAASTSLVAGASIVVLDGDNIQVTVEHSGVEINLVGTQWNDGYLVIDTEITNNGLQPVIKADLKIDVYDLQGNLLASEEHAVFRSIKRMADTYLRPQQTKQGSTIKIELPQQEQYQILSEISELDHRG
ncbi:DUF3157 family protein [Vibrio breoganii]|uniref:DUF3157 family protein n=1 Tax=Vibrio breoganii TaxID=553239 RepID=UPI0002E0DBC7|nr:DUF3157 family protein [Vibrio breoganii]OED93795.1 hypothetical protein A1QG_03300 [Vibrio breoganii ZF-29]OEF87076.1 hypothetical protein B003_14955 [Vibrio breoganii 1C10]PMK50679.1 hypothetical protein BCT98_17505 [Vibrio breoganii]PML41104.1 hypothetical protein BCT77_05145 [Vibrio breoganii]PML97862.1 hypothetical protein BCT64_05960 [Vibrio breoganii]